MEIKQKLTAELIPYANNSKLHNEEQILKIASSIKEFGFNNPVLIDDKNGIIAGHGRVLAAKKLGLKEVPTIALNHLSETQRKAYILADNRLSEIGGGWDEELLNIELEQLKIDFDLNDLGFDDDFMEGISFDNDNDGGESGEFNEITESDLANKCPKCNYEFD